MADQTLSDVITARMRGAGHDQLDAPVAAAKVCITLARLAKAAHDLDDWPTQVRYAEYWGITERQAQREWERYRKAFSEPGDPSIEELGRYVLSELSRYMPDKPRELPPIGILGVRAPSRIVVGLVGLHGGTSSSTTRTRSRAARRSPVS